MRKVSTRDSMIIPVYGTVVWKSVKTVVSFSLQVEILLYSGTWKTSNHFNDYLVVSFFFFFSSSLTLPKWNVPRLSIPSPFGEN